jgi:hypothetical protein
VARHILLDFRRILETAEGPSLYHPYRWWRTLAAGIHGLRDRAGETEKITINLDYVDLGHIDLLVRPRTRARWKMRKVARTTAIRPSG